MCLPVKPESHAQESKNTKNGKPNVCTSPTPTEEKDED